MWPEWVVGKDRTAMQFLVDMCKSMNIEGYLSIDDLYELSEEKIIEKSANCEEKYIMFG